MSGRWRRPAATTLAALALLAIAGSGARPAAAAGDAGAGALQPGRSALQELGTCIGASRRLLVLLLIDESGSLIQTDPDNQRVTAAKAALASLADLGWLLPGQRPTVEVQLAGFSEDYHPVGGWTQVDLGSLPGLEAQVDEFKTRNRGIDTDFANALVGARRALARQSAARSHNDALEPCQALLLFTDGNYDLESRNEVKPYAPGIPLTPPENVAKVIAAGRRLLCRPAGLTDQLRNDGVTTVAVALTTRISRADQGFLKSLAEGRGGATTCGRAGSQATGAYLPTRDLFGLLRAFDAIVNRILSEGTPVPLPGPITPCPRVTCPSGTRTFQVDPSMRGFHLLAELGGKEVEVELRSPGGRAPLVLDRRSGGAGRVGSAQIGSRWLSPTALTIDAALPRARRDWVGEWSVTFIDRGGSREAVVKSQLYLYGDLRPELVGSPLWRLGEPAHIAARIVDADRRPVTSTDLVRSARLSAEVTDPATRRRTPVALAAPDKEGVAKGAWPVPASLQAPRIDLTLWLTVTTKSGLAMVPVSETYRVPVRPPVSHPTVAPDKLRLSPVTGIEPAEGTVTVTGGRAGTGCVWFDPPRFSAVPEGVGAITTTFAPDATSQGRCIKLAVGERREIRVAATPQAEGTGTVRGDLVVTVTSSTEPRPVTVRIPTSFTMVPAPNEPIRWLLFLLFLLVGVALPVAVLALVNLLLAKFEPTDLLRAAKLRVLVDGDRVLRPAGDGRADTPLGELRPEEFRNVEGGSSSRLRSLRLDGLTLRARAPRLPIRAPYGEAAADGRFATASEGSAADRRSVRGRLPLELGGTWVFVLDEPPAYRPAGEDDGDRVAGTLHAFLDEPLDDKGADLAEVVQRDLPAAAHQLAALAAERQPATDDRTGGPDDGPGPYEVTVPTRGPTYEHPSPGDPGDLPPAPTY